MGLTITPTHPGAVTITPSGLHVSVLTPTPPGPVTVGVGLRGPAGVVPPDKPLLRSFDWWVTGEGNTPATMRDRAGDADGVFAGEYQAKVAGPDAWNGLALLGMAGLDAGVEAWPADWDVRFTATIPPHWATGAGEWCEVLIVTAEEDPDVTPDNDSDFFEVAFVFHADGTLAIGVDWDAVTTEDSHWESETVGDWRDGIPRADWRVTKQTVGDDQVFTVYRDDVPVATETIPTADLAPVETAPPGTSLRVGNVGGFLCALHTLQVLDGNDVAYDFDAAAPTGWTPSLAMEGGIFGAPEHPSFHSSGGGRNYQVPDPAVFDVAAGDSVTWLWRFTPLAPNNGGVLFAGRDHVAALTGGGPGWAMGDAAGFGHPHMFLIYDGTDTVEVDVGAFDHDTETTVAVTHNRADDTLRAYRDGVLVDTVDATALDGCSPDAAVDVNLARTFTATAGFVRRALTAGEHATLHTEVSAAPTNNVHSVNALTGDVILDDATVDLAGYETTTGAQTKVDDHNTETTSVHGIVDTAALETAAGAQAKVDAAVATLLGGAPAEALDTLTELAAALEDDQDAVAALVTAIANEATARADADLLKAPLANPTFTGNVVVPDADAATEAVNRQTGDARYRLQSVPIVELIPIKAPATYRHVPGGTPTGLNTSVVPSAGRLNSELWSFDEVTTLDRIYFEVSIAGATGSLIRIGLYTADDSTFMPLLAPLYDLGTLPTDAPGLFYATGPFALSRGRVVCQWITTGGATLKNVGVTTRSMGFVNVAAAGNNQNLVFTPNAAPGFTAAQPFPTPPVACVLAGANGLQQHYITARRT